MKSIPIVEEGVWIPVWFFKPSSIDGFYTTFDAIDADVIRAKPDYRAMFLMGSMDSLVFRAIISFP